MLFFAPLHSCLLFLYCYCDAYFIVILCTVSLAAQRVFHVSGFGDTRPIKKDDPKSAVNRRIELFVLTRSAKQEMDLIFDGTIDIEDQDNVQQQVNSEINRAKNTAQANQR